MHPREELIPLLKKLRLSGVLQTLDLRVQEALGDEVSHHEFLVRLLRDEVERREAKQLGVRLRRANFEHAKTLSDFDFAFNASIPKATVIDLATCGFIGRHENVLLLGQTGVGKSHIAQALGHRACRAGHTVLFVAAHDLFRDLRSGRADGTVHRKIQRYCGFDLLIVDDCLVPASRPAEIPASSTGGARGIRDCGVSHWAAPDSRGTRAFSVFQADEERRLHRVKHAARPCPGLDYPPRVAA